MTPRRRIIKQTAAVSLLPLLAGCELLPGGGPPPTLYRLTPKSVFEEDIPTVDWQLKLELPFANAGLNTTRIVLYPSDTRLDYYAGASWTDRAPNMVLSLIIESFENSKRIVAVSRESVALRSDFLLKTEMREFQAEYFDTVLPRIRVAINAKLIRMADRKIVGSMDFERALESPADQMDDIVKTFDLTLGKVLKRLVGWTLITGQEHYILPPGRTS